MNKKDKKILLIEENASMRETMVDILNLDEFNVTPAKDNKDAWILYQNMHFDLIIMDIILSDLERMRLLMDFKSLHPETKILAIPGEGKLEKNEHINIKKILGKDCILEQFFDIEELKAKVKCLLEKTGN